jgi:hypothetical protein
MTNTEAHLPKRGPGRPPKAPEDRRRNVVQVRFTDDELGRIERLAADAGERVAVFVWRDMLRER